MAYNEYLTSAQNNYGFFNALDADGKFPIEAKSLWATLAEAQEYAEDDDNNAYAGKILVVLEDGDNNGVYVINSIGEGAELEPVGSGAGTIQADDYSAAVELATADNIGQMIYALSSETIGEGDDAVTYDAGLYVVTGNGTVSKIGTTSASGDFGSDIEALQTRVSAAESDIDGLETSVSTLTTNLGNLSTEVSNLDLGDENVIEAITVNGAEVSISDKTAAITFTDTDTTYSNGGGLDLTGTVFSVNDDYITSLIPDAVVYSLTIADTAEGMASTYEFKVDDVVTTTINIPLDQVLSSATIETAGEDDESGFDEGTKYIKFVFQNSDTPQYLNVADLVDVYSGSTYITVGTDNSISVNYDTLKTNLSADLGIDSLAKINTVVTSVTDGLGLTFSGNTLSVSLSVEDLKTSLAIEDTDTTYTEGDHINIASEVISVDVPSLTVSLVSDTTTDGVGASLSALSARIDNISDTDTTYTEGSYVTIDDTDDNAISVDIASLTVDLVTDTTESGIGVVLASKASTDDLEDLEGEVETLSTTVDTLSEAMTWGTI